MTKLEKILNGSTYVKCYRNGYEQCRADMLMPYDVESIEELIVNVRAKVIEEVHRKYTELNERDFAKWLGEEWFKAD